MGPIPQGVAVLHPQAHSCWPPISIWLESRKEQTKSGVRIMGDWLGQGSPRKGWKFCRRIPGWYAAGREAGPMPFRVVSLGT